MLRNWMKDGSNLLWDPPYQSNIRCLDLQSRYFASIASCETSPEMERNDGGSNGIVDSRICNFSDVLSS
jgi:hypothetical protein